MLTEYSREEIELVEAAEKEIKELIRNVTEEEVDELENYNNDPGLPIDIFISLDNNKNVDGIHVQLGHSGGFWFNLESSEMAADCIEIAIGFARENAEYQEPYAN